MSLFSPLWQPEETTAATISFTPTGGIAATTVQGAVAEVDSEKLAIADIDDTPVNGVTTAPISSNWAHDHAASTTAHGISVYGASLVDDADAGTARGTLGLGSSATHDAGDFQPADAELSALAGLSSAADKLPYFNGAGTATLADFTAAGRALVDDASAAAQCTTLGLGTGDSPTFAGQIIRAASPVLTFKDSDCTDADANATITVAATDTGTGAEDVDVSFAQQVAGVPTNFLVSDADGSLTLGQSGQPIVLNGPVGDVTLKDSTPLLKIIDSDTADADAGVSISVSATATGAGAENVDLTITQQVSGSPVNFLVADADGSITLGDATRTVVLSGKTQISGGGLIKPYTSKTGTYPITANDYFVDCTANSFMVTLPTAVGCAGQEYVIKNSGTGTITIATSSSQKIDGQDMFVLDVQYQSMTLISNGAHWAVVCSFLLGSLSIPDL